MNIIRRILWWWQDRPYLKLDLDDLEIADDVVFNLPRLELAPRTFGATTTVNL